MKKYGFIIVILLLIFWVFIYIPQNRRLKAIKDKLKGTEAGISQILEIIKGRELAQAMQELNLRLRKAAGRMPLRLENIINSLSDEAKRLGIEVKNITSSDKRKLEDKIPGYEIEAVDISLKLSSEFKALGEYLNTLKNDFACLVKIKGLDMQGQGEGIFRLDVNLQVEAYLSREKI